MSVYRRVFVRFSWGGELTVLDKTLHKLADAPRSKIVFDLFHRFKMVAFLWRVLVAFHGKTCRLNPMKLCSKLTYKPRSKISLFYFICSPFQDGDRFYDVHTIES